MSRREQWKSLRKRLKDADKSKPAENDLDAACRYMSALTEIYGITIRLEEKTLPSIRWIRVTRDLGQENSTSTETPVGLTDFQNRSRSEFDRLMANLVMAMIFRVGGRALFQPALGESVEAEGRHISFDD